MGEHLPSAYDLIRENLYKMVDAINYIERIGNLHDCNDCGKRKECEYLPKPGDPTRINCPLWEDVDKGAQTEAAQLQGPDSFQEQFYNRQKQER